MRLPLLLLAALLILPATAEASTANVLNGQLSVAGTGSERNRIELGQPASGEIVVRDRDATLTPGTGCTATPAGVLCPGVERIRVQLGDGNDRYKDQRVIPPVFVSGGDGRDRLLSTAEGRRTLFGSNGADTVIASGGSRRRVELRGEDGADVVRNVTRARGTLSGGSGRDTIAGGAGRDDIRGSFGRDRIKGNAGRDMLFGENGADVIIGGTGRDAIQSGAGRDTVRVRDREADRVDCTSSRDAVSADRRLDALIGCL